MNPLLGTSIISPNANICLNNNTTKNALGLQSSSNNTNLPSTYGMDITKPDGNKPSFTPSAFVNARGFVFSEDTDGQENPYGDIPLTYFRNGKMWHKTIQGPVISDTEGLGAIATLPLEQGTTNLDLGGGEFEENTEYLRYNYDVTNLVSDRFKRSKEHNDKIMEKVRQKPADSVTSISVLNVILEEEERRKHIKLAFDSVKEGGMVYFKIWRGDNSGKTDNENSQLNREAVTFMPEISAVFGHDHTWFVNDGVGNTIFAKKITANQIPKQDTDAVLVIDGYTGEVLHNAPLEIIA